MVDINAKMRAYENNIRNDLKRISPTQCYHDFDFPSSPRSIFIDPNQPNPRLAKQVRPNSI